MIMFTTFTQKMSARVSRETPQLISPLISRLFVFLLLIVTVIHADDSTAYDKVINAFDTQWADIVSTGNAAAGSVGVAGNAVYAFFEPTSVNECEDPFLSSTLNPNNPNPNPKINKGTIDLLWIAPSILALIVVFFGIASFYMVGQLLNSPSLIALSKEELYQTTFTIRRIMIVIVVLSLGGLWFSLSAGHAVTDPIYGNKDYNTSTIDAAMQFIRTIIGEMTTDYSMLLLYNTVIHTIYSSTMWFGVTWRAMYSFNMGPVLKPLIDVIGTSLQFLSLSMSEWVLHLVTLCIIKKWTWSLFFPMGILLRAIPFTRNAGEALIAIAFSLALVYPIMFLIDYEAHKIMITNIVDSQQAMHSFITNSGLFNVFGAAVISALLTAGVFLPFFMGGIVSLAFELVRSSVYYTVMMGVLLPFFNIFVTLTSARETARFFGVDVNFFAFLKLI